MHSDGYTFRIFPDLIDLGLDAFNTQIFCMGVDKLEQFKGKITFWGEIDRQHLLVDASPEEVKRLFGVFMTHFGQMVVVLPSVSWCRGKT